MIFPDPKKSATMILSKMKDGVEKQTESKPETEFGASDGLTSAAQDILGAVQSKSPRDLVDALKSFHDIYSSEDGGDDEEQQDDEGFQR